MAKGSHAKIQISAMMRMFADGCSLQEIGRASALRPYQVRNRLERHGAQFICAHCGKRLENVPVTRPWHCDSMCRAAAAATRLGASRVSLACRVVVKAYFPQLQDQHVVVFKDGNHDNVEKSNLQVFGSVDELVLFLKGQGAPLWEG